MQHLEMHAGKVADIDVVMRKLLPTAFQGVSFSWYIHSKPFYLLRGHPSP
jgi:hypothetical protein